MSDDHSQIERNQRICSVVLRQSDEVLEFLAYSGSEGARSLMTDEMADDEKPAEAATRILSVAAGLSADHPPLDLGKSKGILTGEAWHFFCFQVSSAPSEWTHSLDDMEEEHAFFWQPLEDYLDDDQWHPVDIRAMRFVQSRFDKADAKLKTRMLSSSDQGLATTIVEMASERGADKSICPSEVARHIAGGDEKEWRALMKPIRAEAVRLAKEGKVVITRKKVPVDPDNFKGVYRITVRQDG